MTRRQATDSSASAGGTPVGATVSQVLESFAEPAFVVTHEGTVVIANEAARRTHSSVSWLAQLPERREPPAWARGPRVRRIDLGMQSAWLVVLNREQSPAPNPAFGGETNEDARRDASPLPPSLAHVADLLSSGMTDRQIATTTGLSRATVRTYVRRIYRKLGVGSRVELVHRWTGRSRTRGAG